LIRARLFPLAISFLPILTYGIGKSSGAKRKAVSPADLRCHCEPGHDGLTHLALLAITGTPPRADQSAIEIPPLEIRRIGLSEFKQAWIIVSEYNYDILEKSFSIEPPHVPLQKISPGLMKIVLRAFKLTLASGEARVDRL
jgi:hypothetical protein